MTLKNVLVSDGQFISYLTDGIDTELPIMMAFDDVIGVMVTIGGGAGAQWLLIRQRMLILLNLLGQERNYFIRGKNPAQPCLIALISAIHAQYFSEKLGFCEKILKTS